MSADPPSLSPDPCFVEHWIQVRIVVHLQLTVETESALAGEHLRPEVVEALGEVGALLGQDREAVFVAVVMLVGGAGPVNFFGRVIDFQAKNRKTIDNQAGSFGVQRRFRVLRACQLQQKLVDLFDEVVSPLVDAVDRVLHLRDARVGSVGAAGVVFFVPQVEVGEVLRANERKEVCWGGFRGVIAMPEDVGFVVQAENGGCTEFGGVLRNGLRRGHGHGDKGSKTVSCVGQGCYGNK